MNKNKEPNNVLSPAKDVSSKGILSPIKYMIINEKNNYLVVLFINLSLVKLEYKIPNNTK